MTILVNCLNLASAGGLSVAINFLSNLPEAVPSHNYVVVCPSGVGYEELTAQNVMVLTQKPKPAYLRILGETRLFNRIIRQYNISVIFTVGNFALKGVLPQGLVFMWPYAIYPEGEIWDTMSKKDLITRKLRIWYFARRLKYAHTIFPQTQTSKDRLQRHYKVADKKLIIVSTARAELAEESTKAYRKLIESVSNDTLVILCITRYYPHKNLEVLPEVMSRLVSLGLKVKLVLTLEDSQHPNVRVLRESFRSQGVSRSVLNLGLLPLNEVTALYRRADLLLLPTLLESYSGTYVDAMSAGVPICTSDRDFAREVCGDAALYFDPLEPSSVTSAVQEVLTNAETRKALILKGRNRSASSVSWGELSRVYVAELEALEAISDAKPSLTSSND